MFFENKYLRWYIIFDRNNKLLIGNKIREATNGDTKSKKQL